VRSDMVTIDEGSPFVQRIGGATRLKGTDYRDNFIHLEDRPEYESVFVRAVVSPAGGDDVVQHRYRTRTSSGTVQYFQLHARILRNRSGKAIGMLGLDWEVTREEEATREIERQANQLRQAQDRFQRAVSGTQDILFEIDAITGLCWVSPRFYEMS